MKRLGFYLLAEPQGDIYRELIDYSVPHCKVALLVVRHETSLALEAKKILDQLAAFLKQQEESSEWPGTRLLNYTALVRKYKFGPECAQVLKESADALYDWRQPGHPEDLCLLRDDGEPWLISIAHEREGFLYLSQDEVDHLFNALPAIAPLVDRGEDLDLKLPI